jgi:hypothetical protein
MSRVLEKATSGLLWCEFNADIELLYGRIPVAEGTVYLMAFNDLFAGWK